MESMLSRSIRMLVADARARFVHIVVSGLALMLVASLILELWYLSAPLYEIDIAGLSMGDNMALLLLGSRPFEFRPGILFVPPLPWLLLVSSLLALSVMGERTGGLEHARMAALGSRSAWWVCRCVRVAAMAVVEVVALMLAVYAWSLVHGQELTWSLHRPLFFFEGVSVRPEIAFPLSGVPFFVSGFFVFLALAQIQQVIAWFSQTAVALIASCGFLIAASYACTSALFVNALMTVRWEVVSTQSVSVLEALVVGYIFVCVALGAGWTACKRRDLMERGGSR